MQDWLRKGLGTGLSEALSSVDNPHYVFRLMLIITILVLEAVLLLLFVLFHLFYTGNLQTVIINLVGFIAISYLLYDIRKRHDIRLSGHFGSLVIVLFFPVYIHFNENKDFGLIWVFFMPFIIVSFVGWKMSLRYLAVFYMTTLSMAFLNIGEWQNGQWTALSFIRLTMGLLLGTMLAMLMDMSQAQLNKHIKGQRRKEVGYLTELKRLSTTDALTSLYNRRHFNDVLRQKVGELKDSDLYLTFFILDIDHFKLYNDCFGHQKGDEALQKVASAVHHYIKRQNDLVFCLGGEEFGGLLVSEDPQTTALWVAKLTQAVESLHILHAPEASEKYLTISIGVFSAKVSDLNTIDCLYRIADKALYQAKHKGRNQSVIMDSKQMPMQCE
jgi:diguanylate cyclase (GGDEF)-like protein